MRAGTFSAFRVTDCEFSEFAGGRRSASRPILLARCNERCACHAERKPPHAAPRSPFGKLAIRSIFATKASRTRKRAYDIAGKTSGKNTRGRDASLPRATHHISLAAETRSQPSSTHGRSSQAVTKLKSLPFQAQPAFKRSQCPGEPLRHQLTRHRSAAQPTAARLRRKTARRERGPTRRCRGSGTAWTRARRR